MQVYRTTLVTVQYIYFRKTFIFYNNKNLECIARTILDIPC